MVLKDNDSSFLYLINPF